MPDVGERDVRAGVEIGEESEGLAFEGGGEIRDGEGYAADFEPLGLHESVTDAKGAAEGGHGGGFKEFTACHGWDSERSFRWKRMSRNWRLG